MTPLSIIRDTALRMAGRTDAIHAQTLRHIAMDAQAALDGCPESLESVIEYLEEDEWFAKECADRAAEADESFLQIAAE